MPSATAKVPRRSPLSGGYARGQEQRARIIEAALKVFGQEGYERASTRMIAREAGIQAPALQYYFDGKEGLNRACAEFIVQQAMVTLEGPLEAAGAVRADARPRVLLSALCDLLEALADVSLFSSAAPAQVLFWARAQHDDSPAGRVLREKVSDPLIDTCAGLVARITDLPTDEARLSAMLVVSQMSALHANRETTLAKLGWPDFDGPRRTMIKAMLRAHTSRALGLSAPPRKPTLAAADSTPSVDR